MVHYVLYDKLRTLKVLSKALLDKADFTILFFYSQGLTSFWDPVQANSFSWALDSISSYKHGPCSCPLSYLPHPFSLLISVSLQLLLHPLDLLYNRSP